MAISSFFFDVEHRAIGKGEEDRSHQEASSGKVAMPKLALRVT